MGAAHLSHTDENQKAQEQIQYQQMVSEVEDYAILLLDSTGIVQTWSPGVKKIRGYEADEMSDQPFTLFYTEEERDAQVPQRMLEEAGKQGYSEHVGWKMRKDGSRFWGKAVVTALYDASGEVKGFAEVTRDLTCALEKERKIHELNSRWEEKVEKQIAEWEQIRRELEEEVADRQQELQAFSYSVSHDLQAPLRAITGYSAILLEDFNERLGDEGQRLLGVVIRNVDRMNQLIKKVLEFSRLTRQKIFPHPLDMKRIFVQSYQQLRKSEPASRTIEFQTGDLPAGYGDHDMIGQAITHLLSNALKYTRPQENTLIQVSGRQEEKECVYSVQDNGVGFDERYKGKLFEIFQRLHKESEFEGIGVGLAMVQHIIRKHGGRVWGTGQPGQGATFYFTLPLATK